MLAIAVDSGCAPTVEMMKKYNPFFIGMKIIIDDKEYTDNVEFRDSKFYEIIKKAKDFKTAQPPLGMLLEFYNSVKEAGYDELVDIHFSSKLSGLYSTAIMAAEMVKGIKVHVVDTMHISITAGLVTRRIMEMLVDEKRPVDEVMSLVPKIRKNTLMQFNIPTMEYLVKNGRIGHATALAGKLLNIKPILTVDDEGFLSPSNKLRGMKKVFNQMAENSVEFFKTHNHNKRMYLIYGFKEYKNYMEKTLNLINKKLTAEKMDLIEDIMIGRIWPTVACHSGPAVFGISCYGEETEI